MTHPKFRWAPSVAAIAVFAMAHAHASTALLPASSTSGQTLSVQTYAGPAELTITAVRPSASITILLLTDTLTAADNAEVHKQLLDFCPSFHGHPIQIAFLRKNGEFTTPVPASSRVRFKQLLDSIASTEDPQTVPSPAVLDDLAAVVPKVTPKGSTLLVVGEFPKLDSASTMFASALL